MGKFWTTIKSYTRGEQIAFGVLMALGIGVAIWGWWWPPAWIVTDPFRLNLATAAVGFCIGLPIALTVISAIAGEAQDRAAGLARNEPLRGAFVRFREAVEDLGDSECMRLVRHAAADEDLRKGEFQRIARPAPFTNAQVAPLWEKHSGELSQSQYDWRDELVRFDRGADRAGKNASAEVASGEALADRVDAVVEAIGGLRKSLECGISMRNLTETDTRWGGPSGDERVEYDNPGDYEYIVQTLSLFGSEHADLKLALEVSGREWIGATKPDIREALRGLYDAAAPLQSAVESINTHLKDLLGSSEWKPIL